MQDITSRQRNEFRSHTVSLSAARRWPQSHARGRLRQSQTGPRRWVLVHVWDGAVLAAFDDEASARAVMSCADDDEVVVLCVDT
jgi:hypothetical protein